MKKTFLFLLAWIGITQSYAQEEMNKDPILSVYQFEKKQLELNFRSSVSLDIKNANTSSTQLQENIDFHTQYDIINTINKNNLSIVIDDSEFKNNTSDINGVYNVNLGNMYNVSMPTNLLFGDTKLNDAICISIADNYTISNPAPHITYTYSNTYFYIYDKKTKEFIGSVNYVKRLTDFLETEFKFIDVNEDYLLKHKIKNTLKSTYDPLVYNSNKFTIYPNPSTYKVVFHLELIENQTVTLQIYDMYNRIVKTVIDNNFLNKGMQEYVTDVTGLANGNYVIKLLTGNDILTSRLTIVNQ